MKKDLLNMLWFPFTNTELRLEHAFEKDCEIESGFFTTKEGNQYPIVQGVPRFVPKENYANSFGFQWNRFRET